MGNNDNGNLNLKTKTLDVSSLNNTYNSKSMSMGINVGIANKKKDDKTTDSSLSSIGIDYSNDRTNRKSKTLATIGSGNITIGNKKDSNTKMLNRDIKDNEIDIYDVSSHKGLKGEVDTRVFTQKGREDIKQELYNFGKNMQVVAQGLPKANDSNAIKIGVRLL